MESLVSMPGSFLPDFDQPVRPTLSKAIARPSIFVPPHTPTALSSLTRSFRPPPRHAATPGKSSRKRARLEPIEASTYPLEFAQSQQPIPNSSWSTSSFTSSSEHPAPLTNSEYLLKDGVDTPITFSDLTLDEKENLSLDRPSRFSARTTERDGYFPYTPPDLGRDCNWEKHGRSSPSQLGWGKAIYHAVGDVAGKVFNFCNTAFRGFYAGGGKGYEMDVSTPVVIDHYEWLDPTDKEDVFNQKYEGRHYRQTTPVPGGFPDSDFIEDYMSHPQSHQNQAFVTPTPSQSLKTNSNTGQCLRRNWVFVKESGADSRESSPSRGARKVPRTASVAQVRQSPQSGRALLHPSRPGRGSYAGSSGLSFDRPTPYAPPRSRPHTASGRHRRSQSFATPPARDSAVHSSLVTPTRPDVQLFEKRIRQREKTQDHSLTRLNQHTQAMIRQAKEALGTRIDIEDEADMDDEGYGEGTHWMENSKW